jgi:hypothetical protein
VVFVAGLTDGFMATPYLAQLQARLASGGWSLVQALLSSSYAGYGHSSLRQDVQELDALVQHLVLEFSRPLMEPADAGWSCLAGGVGRAHEPDSADGPQVRAMVRVRVRHWVSYPHSSGARTARAARTS